jgi:hypothetical protein
MFKFFSQYLAFFKLMWKSMVEPLRAQLTVYSCVKWRRHAGWPLRG